MYAPARFALVIALAACEQRRSLPPPPLHLCPVCLRKLWWAVPFDAAAREDALAAVWRKLGLDAEADWSARRAARIRGAPL